MADILALLKDVNFLLKCIAAILSLVLVILWGALDFFTGMTNMSKIIMYAHASPAFTVVLWGMILGYVIEAQPPPQLILLWSLSGAIMFLATGVVQLIFYADRHKNNDVLVLAILHLVEAGILIADFVMQFIS